MIQNGYGARKSRIPGVYRLPKFDDLRSVVDQRAGLIVVHQLAVTEETLWLRMLGREENQNLAIQEFLGQSTSSVLYGSIEKILANYRANLEANRPLESEEEELIMNLSAAYLKKREEWKDEGILEGILEGKAITAINLLREGFSVDLIVRATGLPIETIESLRDRV